MRGINSSDKRDLRRELHQRYDGRCAYCERHLSLRRGTVDHYMPTALGGSNERANLRWCCRPCNEAKADMHPDAWEAVLVTMRKGMRGSYQVKVRLLAAVAQRRLALERVAQETAGVG